MIPTGVSQVRRDAAGVELKATSPAPPILSHIKKKERKKKEEELILVAGDNK